MDERLKPEFPLADWKTKPKTAAELTLQGFMDERLKPEFPLAD